MDVRRWTRASVIAAGLMSFALITAVPRGARGQETAVGAQNPDTEAQSAEAQGRESRGIPPRAAPTDYQARAQAGKITIGAEFKGHSLPTPDATFTSEDYVSVEVGLFGPPDAHLALAPNDFIIRVINKGKGAIAMQAKKAQVLQAQPYALVFKSLKDPSWEPPAKPESKSKTTINDSGNGDPPPPTPKMPFNLVRAMDQKVQRATLPEGDRPLPVAGLIYFSFHGKPENVRVMQLVYSGPAGQATLDLEP